MFQFILMIIASRFESVAFEEFTCVQLHSPTDLRRKSHTAACTCPFLIQSYTYTCTHILFRCASDRLWNEYVNTRGRSKVTEQTERRNNYRKQSATIKDTSNIKKEQRSKEDFHILLGSHKAAKRNMKLVLRNSNGS